MIATAAASNNATPIPPSPARRYVGRFAPSPTGPLHAGSLVAALASWLDARAHGGQWLVRIENVDTPRCQPGADAAILAQLTRCGLHPDAPVLWQSTRHARYAQMLEYLLARRLAYPCACTRKDIEQYHLAAGHERQRHHALPYPGTCRHGLHGRSARAFRFHTAEFEPKAVEIQQNQAQPAHLLIASDGVHWHDRRLGWQQQCVTEAVGDFVLRRADGLWAYQLAVVVDDADQDITHVVRGEDLADNTPRQILLQCALGLSTPEYLHTPLVRDASGEKLSKQHGAAAVDLSEPVAALAQAAAVLGLPALPHSHHIPLAEALSYWVNAWARIYNGSS
ncbi:MAG: tRNA glutamyl-Q(34) synthetase GluQRS [Burkholderiaceae bacterium]